MSFIEFNPQESAQYYWDVFHNSTVESKYPMRFQSGDFVCLLGGTGTGKLRITIRFQHRLPEVHFCATAQEFGDVLEEYTRTLPRRIVLAALESLETDHAP